MSIESRRAITAAQRVTPSVPSSADRAREAQEREEQHRRDIEKAMQTATAVVDETLAPERAALVEQQEFLILQALIIEAGRTALPGKILIPDTANQSLLVSMINPGETASLALLKNILQQYADRFNWMAATTPAQRKQQDQQRDNENRKIFAEAARTYGFSECEANFNILKTTLEDFNVYQIGRATQSNAVSLAPATESDKQRWTAERAQQRTDFLQSKATIPELRTLANQESAQTRAAATAQAAEASYQASIQRDAPLGYKQLSPDATFRGEKITAEFLMNRRKCDGDVLRILIRLYGQAQVTARLRGIA